MEGTTGILVRKENRQQIPPWQTLRAAGVQNDEVLEIIFERIAGTNFQENKYPWGNNFLPAKSKQYFPYEILKYELPLPYIVTVNDFFSEVSKKVKAIDYIYSVFALLVSGEIFYIDQYLSSQKEKQTIKQLPITEKVDETEFEISAPRFKEISIKYLLKQASIEPLRVVSAHYGSPASFDLLGIGKILEIIRDTSKDIAWRAEHELKLAELDRKSKQAKIQQVKLDNKKKSVEIINQRLEAEKTALEIAVKKLELIEKINGLQLSVSDKQVIVSALLPKVNTLSKGLTIPLLQSERQDKLPPNLSNGE